MHRRSKGAKRLKPQIVVTPKPVKAAIKNGKPQ